VTRSRVDHERAGDSPLLTFRADAGTLSPTYRRRKKSKRYGLADLAYWECRSSEYREPIGLTGEVA
jgi:hypothetical protein